jgi:hypothetical protein
LGKSTAAACRRMNFKRPRQGGIPIDPAAQRRFILNRSRNTGSA